jgi:hypothetical protein
LSKRIYDLGDNNYLSSNAINLRQWIINGSYTTTGNDNKYISIDIEKTGLYIVDFCYSVNQNGYKDNVLDFGVGDLNIGRDVRNTWTVSGQMSNTLFLEQGNQQVARVSIWNANTVVWTIKLTYLGNIK